MQLLTYTENTHILLHSSQPCTSVVTTRVNSSNQQSSLAINKTKQTKIPA
eukprot:UN06285